MAFPLVTRPLARVALWLGNRCNANLDAALGKMPCGHVPVAAIVTGAD